MPKKKVERLKVVPEDRFCAHCKPSESTCAGHCRKFALSDGCDQDFKTVCQHIESCDQCQTVKAVFQEVDAEIEGSLWNPYNDEH